MRARAAACRVVALSPSDKTKALTRHGSFYAHSLDGSKRRPTRLTRSSARSPGEAFARVLLDLLLGLENPVPRVEVERDDEHENSEADPTRPAGRASVAGRAHSCLLRLGD